MALPLEQVDTSVIEELVVLKRDREVLAERLARMIAEKEQVSQAVFQRVHSDYQARLGALEKGAAPKKDQARREYAKLRSLLDEVRTQHETANQDKEELEFRHRLGEFEPRVFEEKNAEIVERISTHERELAEVTAVRERFVAAFDSEDELAQTPAPVRSAPPVAPTPVASSPIVQPPTAARQDSQVFAAPPPPEPSSGTASGSTVVTDDFVSTPPPISTGGETLAAPPRADEAPAPAATPLGGTVILKDIAPPKGESLGLGMTMIVSSARLVPIGGGPGVAEYRVQPFTSIGRTRQNQVQLDEPSVSRKHAQIALTDGVYTVTDLQSENGTFVNGDRITERRLNDGDRLQFGSIRFSFHTT